MSDEQRKAIEETPVPAVIHRDGKILYANRATLRMMGAKDDADFKGRSVLDFLTPAYRLAAKVRWQRVLAGQPLLVRNASAKLIRLDGTTFSATAHPFRVVHDGADAILTFILERGDAAPRLDVLERLLTLFQ